MAIKITKTTKKVKKKMRTMTKESQLLAKELKLDETIKEWVDVGCRGHFVSVGDRKIVKLCHLHAEGNCPEFHAIVNYLQLEDFLDTNVVRLDEYE